MPRRGGGAGITIIMISSVIITNHHDYWTHIFRPYTAAGQFTTGQFSRGDLFICLTICLSIYQSSMGQFSRGDSFFCLSLLVYKQVKTQLDNIDSFVCVYFGSGGPTSTDGQYSSINFTIYSGGGSAGQYTRNLQRIFHQVVTHLFFSCNQRWRLVSFRLIWRLLQKMSNLYPTPILLVQLQR